MILVERARSQVRTLQAHLPPKALKIRAFGRVQITPSCLGKRERSELGFERQISASASGNSLVISAYDCKNFPCVCKHLLSQNSDDSQSLDFKMILVERARSQVRTLQAHLPPKALKIRAFGRVQITPSCLRIGAFLIRVPLSAFSPSPRREVFLIPEPAPPPRRTAQGGLFLVFASAFLALFHFLPFLCDKFRTRCMI